jgi:hypothetical protein
VVKKLKSESKPLKGYGVRADEDKMREAYSLQIDTGELFRKALDAELLKRGGVCPTCGNKQKGV